MPSNYEAAVMVDAPIAYYRLNEVSGTSALDQISGNNATIGTGTTLGATALVPGDIIDPAQTSFTGPNAATAILALPAAISFATSVTGITLEFWANMPALVSSTSFQLGTGLLVLLPYTANAVYVYMNGAAVINNFSTGVVTGAVHHWAITWKNTTPFTVSLYKDGALVTSAAGAVLSATSTGGSLGINSPLLKLDNVAIYNKELSAARVLAHYQAGLSTALTGAVAASAALAGNLTGALKATANVAASAVISLATIALSATTSYDVLRSLAGLNQWTRIAAAVPVSGFQTTLTFDDYSAAANVLYDYQIVANGPTASTPSFIRNVSLTWPLGVWIHDPTNPAGSAHFFLYDNGARGDTLTPEMALVTLDGRQFPLAEFSGRDAQAMQVYLDLLWNTSTHQSPDYEALKQFVANHNTVCIRDHRSRKLYGVIPSLAEADALLKSTTTLTVSRVDYSEAV